MKKFLRPSLFLGMGLGLLLAVLGALRWWPRNSAPLRPVAMPVAEGDLEVAWLNSATSFAAWERFVTAASQTAGVTPGPESFPAETTAVPELAIPLQGRKGRLVFRWYKLTGDWKNSEWLEALLARDPPPLAIIGGSTSDAGGEQARQLARLTENLPDNRRPLLLLTTATADKVKDRRRSPGDDREDATEVALMDVYPDRTFRFSFTNRQMGRAVVNYLWSQPELRPDTDPVYLTTWQDDSYSSDLIAGFWRALAPAMTQTTARTTASDVVGLAATSATNGHPLTALSVGGGRFHSSFRQHFIPWSVGTFDRPNRFEAAEAGYLLDELDENPGQKRPLLVLGGQSQPSRRFLRALCRTSPMRARSFVVATGDAISFNTVYRDRNVAWPIQDLPCSLVFFCHHNPVDQSAGFRSSDSGSGGSGTEDLLLYADILQALRLATITADTPGAVRERLFQLSGHGREMELGGDGEALFDRDGDRRSGSGEHVVWLRPVFRGERVLPEADLTVSAWQPRAGVWKSVGGPFRVYYNQAGN